MQEQEGNNNNNFKWPPIKLGVRGIALGALKKGNKLITNIPISRNIYLERELYRRPNGSRGATIFSNQAVNFSVVNNHYISDVNLSSKHSRIIATRT